MVINFENNNKIESPNNPEKENLFSQTTVYINASGRGTRLESIFPKGPSGVTKALIDFNGEPMIQNHTDLLADLGLDYLGLS
ncbi:MAG: hypothetical protein RBS77_04695 [Candidatus Moranbacteria bacterium]|jgi:hypothetical protein|nr:hypothetical protein [Candidatus Moranbacteria bacterium]